MGDYIFVHGGIPTDDAESLAGTDAFPWLKNDSFYTQGHRFSRCVAVGHWPARLYRDGPVNHEPLMDTDRRIFCMDGSCGLEYTGQLNVLIFPDACAPPERIAYVFADSLPTVTALAPQSAVPPTLCMSYYNSGVEHLQNEANGLTLCRHLQTGRTVRVPTHLVYTRDGGVHWWTQSFTDARLAVQAGDTLSVVWRGAQGIYGKRGSTCGWYDGPWAEAPLPPAPTLEEFL